MNIVKEILSFPETVGLSKKSEKSVWLLRHSMRESLSSGTLDPGLTVEGSNYAHLCGELLAGIDNPAFGASPRLRCIETAKAIISGGNYGEQTVSLYPDLHDTAMFNPPEALKNAVVGGYTAELLHRYFSTGTAPEMVPLHDFAGQTVKLLQSSENRNTILTTHDIVIVSLLLDYGVYDFQQDDWCGYIHGVFLRQDPSGEWHIAYTVPDTEKRQKYQLFI